MTTHRKPIVTLVSTGQARVGTIFFHRGPGSKCESCQYFQACVKNLEPGRVYKIVKLRDKTLPCGQYETEMQVVEVLDGEIPSAIPAKQAIEGAVITFQMVDCREETCNNCELCFPKGLKAGDRCEVQNATETLPCSEGFLLKKVSLRRVPVS